MTIQVQQLGQVEYLPTFAAMKAFTASRTSNTAQNAHQIDLQPNQYRRDQLWICEHPAIYTQGLAGKVEHVLNPGNIPVVQTDLGGRVLKKARGSAKRKPCKIDGRLRRRNAHST